MQEIWEDVKGLEGIYKVSNMGNVKSCDRNVYKVNGTIQPRKGKKIKPYTGSCGYLYFKVGFNGMKKNLSVHRSMAMAFLPNYENKPQVNHINGIKKDNILSNLEWCTVSENNKHAFDLGLNKRYFGSDNPRSKCVLQYDLSDNLIAEHGSIHEAMRVTGINFKLISAACKRNSLTDGRDGVSHGYKWMIK